MPHAKFGLPAPPWYPLINTLSRSRLARLIAYLLLIRPRFRGTNKQALSMRLINGDGTGFSPWLLSRFASQSLFRLNTGEWR